MLRLDFGRSFVHRTDISDDLKQKLPITLQLTVMAFILSSLVALPLGLLSAMNQDRISDYVARFVTIGRGIDSRLLDGYPRYIFPCPTV